MLFRSSLSRMLPKLADDGFITRHSHQNDQRRIVVAITARGRTLFRSVAPESEEIYTTVEREFGAKGLRELYQLLDRLIETLEAAESRPQSASSRRRRR